MSQGDPQPSFLESVPEEEELQTERHVQIDIMDDSGRLTDINEEERAKSVNSASRMPMAMTRARLVRTPASKDERISAPSPESPEENHDPHEPDVLITELKDPPTENSDDEAEESDIEPEYQQVTVETVDAEEDWDTDLEVEGMCFVPFGTIRHII